jgi:hypothetical protein
MSESHDYGHPDTRRIGAFQPGLAQHGLGTCEVVADLKQEDIHRRAFRRGVRPERVEGELAPVDPADAVSSEAAGDAGAEAAGAQASIQW